MKKKIMAALLALIVAFVSVPVTFAESLKDIINAYTDGLGIPRTDVERQVDVPTDISLKKAGESTYVNGPLTLHLSDAQATSFDFKAEIDMSEVLVALAFYRALAEGMHADATDKPAVRNDIENSYVKGGFEIKIHYPTGVTIPNSVKNITDMSDFSSKTQGKNLNAIYELESRSDDGNGTLTIKVKVHPDKSVNLSNLEANLDSLILECSGIQISQPGTYSITGEVSGWTQIFAPDDTTLIGNLKYGFTQKPNDSVAYVDPSNPGAISGTVNVYVSGGSSSLNTKKTLTVVIGDGIDSKQFKYSPGTNVVTKDIEIPSRPGYKLEGLYKDAEFTQPLEETFKINNNMTVYAKWIEDTVISPFDSEDHFAYVIGYPTNDGSEIVRPEANITREEITTIYYRLLKDEIREQMFTDKNNFSDVEVERWSNKAISTMANGGYIQGYEDGTFGPGKSATRAEFVTIAARFYNVDADSIVMKSVLTDIDGHWAAAYIDYAVTQGWINGYDDGSFRPDQNITRAEVMKIVNSMLNRHVNEEGLVEDAIRWDDNPQNKWYYYEVIEATNAHDYERAVGETYEKWTQITENKVWTEKSALEDAE